jgi:hypothetical protein
MGPRRILIVVAAAIGLGIPLGLATYAVLGKLGIVIPGWVDKPITLGVLALSAWWLRTRAVMAAILILAGAVLMIAGWASHQLWLLVAALALCVASIVPAYIARRRALEEMARNRNARAQRI